MLRKGSGSDSGNSRDVQSTSEVLEGSDPALASLSSRVCGVSYDIINVGAARYGGRTGLPAYTEGLTV